MGLIKRPLTLLLKWVDGLLPNGLYRGVLRSLIQSLEKLTWGYWLNKLVRECLGKTKLEWPAELLQVSSLGIGILLLAILGRYPISQNQLVVVLIWIIILWRIGEVLIFALNWVFIHSGGVISYRRSLAGFGVNIGEIIVYFALAYWWAGCVVEKGTIFTALYSSLRTVVTIGPTLIYETGGCGALIMSQITIAYFLAVVVIANVVGSIRRVNEE